MIHSGPEVLFKTCVMMKFVDDDDDDDDDGAGPALLVTDTTTSQLSGSICGFRKLAFVVIPES